MRSVALSIFALICASGCTTVSMVPGEAVVETGITPEQSSLRNVCDAYVKQAKAEHWVTPSNGIIGFAKVLIDGVSDRDDTPRTYAEIIEAETADPGLVYQRLSADIAAARDGLEVVTSQANAFIATSTASKKSLRRDVVSYESVLVTAQKSRRNFAKAIAYVAERGDERLSAVEADLTAFDIAIDAARETADSLADAHASMPNGNAVS